MGCFASSPSAAAGAEKTSVEVELFGLPAPWKSDRPLTQEALERKREEFWLTNGSGAYGGQPEIWNALRAAAAADIDTARLIVESAGILVTGRDLQTSWDSRGALYVLPPFVLSAPTNLVQAA